MHVRAGAPAPTISSSPSLASSSLSSGPASSRLALSPLMAPTSTPFSAQPWAGGGQATAFAKALRAAQAAAGTSALGAAGEGRGAGAGKAARPIGRPQTASDEAADELDAAARQAAHLAPPAAILEGPIQPLAPTPGGTLPAAASGPSAPTSLEELLPALVRKIAWSGDARRGTVRIELGAGALAGATLLVAANGGRVQVTLIAEATHSDVDLDTWRERIAARLSDRGLDADVT
jgi:hypothetical protein